jgi:preprotein translocase subunit SecE
VNRQTKRLLQRQGQLGEDGAPAARTPASTTTRPTTTRPPAGGRGAPSAERPSFPERTGQYLREVRNELAKVAWPPRTEVVNYSTVVIVTLVLLTALIFALNYLFAKGIFKLFNI